MCSLPKLLSAFSLLSFHVSFCLHTEILCDAPKNETCKQSALAGPLQTFKCVHCNHFKLNKNSPYDCFFFFLSQPQSDVLVIEMDDLLLNFNALCWIKRTTINKYPEFQWLVFEELMTIGFEILQCNLIPTLSEWAESKEQHEMRNNKNMVRCTEAIYNWLKD